eukprot:COSAG02_NODE_25321_length_662_cov_0.753108_1_plen_175_part_10
MPRPSTSIPIARAISTVNLRAASGVIQFPSQSRKAGVWAGSSHSPSNLWRSGPSTAIAYGFFDVRSITAGFVDACLATSLVLLEFFCDGGLKISASQPDSTIATISSLGLSTPRMVCLLRFATGLHEQLPIRTEVARCQVCEYVSGVPAWFDFSGRDGVQLCLRSSHLCSAQGGA